MALVAAAGAASLRPAASDARGLARAAVRRVLERVVERRQRGAPSAARISQSANQAFLGSSGPCR